MLLTSRIGGSKLDHSCPFAYFASRRPEGLSCKSMRCSPLPAQSVELLAHQVDTLQSWWYARLGPAGSRPTTALEAIQPQGGLHLRHAGAQRTAETVLDRLQAIDHSLAANAEGRSR